MVAGHLASAEQLTGAWSATLKEHTLGGGWTAQAHEEPDAAYGAWNLLDQSERVLASGTWSMRKVKDAWEGRWVAEVEGGGKYSGSWAARLSTPGLSPLFGLFRSAVSKAVGGTWRSDNGLSGTWSIQTDQDE
jgi:hypothetical protein